MQVRPPTEPADKDAIIEEMDEQSVYRDTFPKVVVALEYWAVACAKNAVPFAVDFSPFADFIRFPQNPYRGYEIRLHRGFMDDYITWGKHREKTVNYPNFEHCVYFAFRHSHPWTQALRVFLSHYRYFRNKACRNFFHTGPWHTLLNRDYCQFRCLDNISNAGLFAYAKEIFQLQFEKYVDIAFRVIQRAREMYPDGIEVYIPESPQISEGEPLNSDIALFKKSVEERMSSYEPFKVALSAYISRQPLSSLPR